MYKKIVKKYGRIQYTKTEKENVLSDFMEDIASCEPTNIRTTKKTLFVYYNDGKYSEMYVLPIKYIECLNINTARL